MEYLKNNYSELDLKTKGIVIGHDNRNFSFEFSQEIANIFSSNNIKAILFANNDIRPTPVISYSIKKIDAIAGIIITASHNSKEYNGYKIYDSNGSQFLPIITNIIGENYLKIKEEVFNLILNPDPILITYVSKEIEENYIIDVKTMQFYPNQKRNIKIVFSNLHGTSKEWTPKILKDCGYEVFIVKEQFSNDPNFTFAPNPNPELIECYNLALKYAKKVNADLIILNDPDADRLGIGVKINNCDYYLMNGNETAPVLIEYLFSHYQNKKILPKNGVMYNTFVTSNLSDKVAESYGVKVIKTLTGFKWIGDQINKESEKKLKFLFGFEEAYGYLLKDIIRDKDGIQTSLVLAEACWYYYNQKKTLYDVLLEQYNKFGFFYCETINLIYDGINSKKNINNILKKFRDKNISSLYKIKCVKKEDYLYGLYGMPGQDLLKFYFEDGSWFAVRASGTEPKIKLYFVCVDKTIEKSKIKMIKMYQELKNIYLI